MPKGIYERRPRQPKSYPTELVGKVRDLYAAGLTQAEVAIALKTSQKVVYALMKRHGIAARAQKVRPEICGARHPAWRGDAVSYSEFHLRLYKSRGRQKLCDECGESSPRKTYDWANQTGNYQDESDYRRLCRSCHRKFDNARKRGS